MEETSTIPKKWPKEGSIISASAADRPAHFSSKSKELINIIERRLEEVILEKKVPYNHLFQAARYSLLNGGKRLRPLLTLAACETLGGNVDAALTAACAIEIIHTYSMIHDDLPCMDDDDFRRGVPTLHKIYSDGHAVLTGDYLLTLSFQLITEDRRLNPQQKVELINILSKASGGDGMVGGQVMDLSSEKRSIPLDELRLLHRMKTGALFTAAVEFGAIIAQAPQGERALLRKFSKELGLAFQIIDDILDITASHEKRGTPTSSDKRKNKATFPLLIGLDRAKAEMEIHTAACENILNQLDRDTGFLKFILSENMFF